MDKEKSDCIPLFCDFQRRLVSEVSIKFGERELEHVVDQVLTRIETETEEYPSMTKGESKRLAESILDEIWGFGPIGPLLRDFSITAIFVEGSNSTFIRKESAEVPVTEAAVHFHDEEHLVKTIKKFFPEFDAEVDKTKHMMYCLLPTGDRAFATLPPVTRFGYTLTIVRAK